MGEMNSLHLTMYNSGKLSQTQILAFYPAHTTTTLAAQVVKLAPKLGKA